MNTPRFIGIDFEVGGQDMTVVTVVEASTENATILWREVVTIASRPIPLAAKPPLGPLRRLPETDVSNRLEPVS